MQMLDVRVLIYVVVDVSSGLGNRKKSIFACTENCWILLVDGVNSMWPLQLSLLCRIRRANLVSKFGYKPYLR